MKPFRIVTGPAAVLPLADIDTDVIIRIEHLTGANQDQLGTYAFEALRYNEDGSEKPDFPLNRPRWRGAPILLAGPNFGCGSSREGAVTALAQMGIRCVVASSFGDIFYSNCFQNGVLPIRLPQADVLALSQVAEASRDPFRIDLERQCIVDSAGMEHGFAVPGVKREALLAGLDDLGLTLGDAAAIANWQMADRARRSWLWQTVARKTA